MNVLILDKNTNFNFRWEYEEVEQKSFYFLTYFTIGDP